MLKRVLFIGLLMVLFLASGSMFAKETSKSSYTWTKIGDDFFEVWDVNGILFVENPTGYNQTILWKSGEVFNSWDEAKLNRSRLGLRSSTVKFITPTRELSVAENQLFYTKIKYGNSQELPVKVIRDHDKVWISEEENSDSPVIFRSKNSSYHIFVDGDGIWGIQPLLTNPMGYEVSKLTKDLVNGKTRAEIAATLEGDESLYWNSNPQINPEGNYVAYGSNKGDFGFQLWLIDIQNKTDQNLNINIKGDLFKLYGWADSHTIVYSLGQDYYLYDIKTNKSKQLLKSIRLLTFNEKDFVYTKQNDDLQIYFYQRATNKEVILPRLPDIALFDPYFSNQFLSLSSDGSKLLVLTPKDSNSSKSQRAIYLLNSDKKSITEIKFTEDQNPDSLGKWIGVNQVVIYTHEYDYISRRSSWILTFSH